MDSEWRIAFKIQNAGEIRKAECYKHTNTHAYMKIDVLYYELFPLFFGNKIMHYFQIMTMETATSFC